MIRSSIFAAAVIACCSSACADVLFNDIDGSTSSSNGEYQSVAVAAAFTPIESATLTRTSVFIDQGPPGPPTYFDAALLTDSSGKPGTVLAEVQNVLAPVDPAAVTIDFSASPVTLTADVTYWLALAPAPTPYGFTPPDWFGSATVDDLSTYFGTQNFDGPWQRAGDSGVQFEIDGTPATASVPEPAALLVTITGFGLLVAARWRAQLLINIAAALRGSEYRDKKPRAMPIPIR